MNYFKLKRKLNKERYQDLNFIYTKRQWKIRILQESLFGLATILALLFCFHFLLTRNGLFELPKTLISIYFILVATTIFLSLVAYVFNRKVYKKERKHNKENRYIPFQN